jgi:dipeptidyl aminopeptidase/acylaminoacyl peptidase
LYDIASGENKALIQTDNILLTAGWAVDRKTIAYVAEVDGQYDLFSVNEETLEILRLSNTIEFETMALWSPTALQLLVGTVSDERSAFETWPWGVSKLTLLDLNSGNELLLVEKWFGSESIAWSADGSQIVFSDAGLLCIKNLETMVETCPLAGVAPYDDYFASFWEPPVWIAGSSWLAFQAFTGTCDELFFLNLEDNTVTLGDLSCKEITGSPLAPIYWLR